MNVYIVYELRNREYDNALLLKVELESRGYKVEIINKQKMFRWRYKKGIILIPNCYRTEDYDFYNYSLNGRNNHIINLQVEQIRSKKIEENGFCNPKGKAKDIIHLCWGKNSYERLINNNISKDNLRITGAIHLDFLRQKFDKFWYTRSEIAKMYNLPENKRWILYISSFAYVNNDVVVDKLREDFGGAEKAKHIDEFEKISVISHSETLNYIEKLIENNNEIIVIYRNHPVEKNNSRIDELKKIYSNSFYNISELNIKQWINISDQVITWFSTAIVESFAAKKMCHILRPIEIPEDIDATIYSNANNIIDNYYKLEDIIDNYKTDNFNKDFPIDISSIERDYEISDIPSFIRIADLVDEYKNKELRKIEDSYSINRIKYILKNNIILKYYAKLIYELLYDKFGFKIKKYNLRNKFAFENLEKDIDNKRLYKEDTERKCNLLKYIRGLYYEQQ